MAAKKKKAKTSKKAVRRAPKKTKVKKAPAKKARKAKAARSAKPTKKAKASKSKKAAARKPAKKAPVRKRKLTVGEGDYEASRAFLKDQSDFVKENKAKIPEMGRDARSALEGSEGASLMAAEAEAKSHAKAPE